MKTTRPKALILGHTGKLGTALTLSLSRDYQVFGRNSKDFDAAEPRSLRRIIREIEPDLVFNTVAFVGVDACESSPINALMINSIFPKYLAELSSEFGFTLIHFSTDAVFPDKKDNDAFIENDSPCPPNMYGCTKFNGDALVASCAYNYYICRLSLLFGPTDRDSQFVEKMLRRVRSGEKRLHISDDIICSPSYSLDVAQAIIDLLHNGAPYGLYHIANPGRCSLYELMNEFIEILEIPVEVIPVSHTEFPSIAIKNKCTPLRSEKLKPLRSRQSALTEYAEDLKRRREL